MPSAQLIGSLNLCHGQARELSGNRRSSLSGISREKEKKVRQFKVERKKKKDNLLLLLAHETLRGTFPIIQNIFSSSSKYFVIAFSKKISSKLRMTDTSISRRTTRVHQNSCWPENRIGYQEFTTTSSFWWRNFFPSPPSSTGIAS